MYQLVAGGKIIQAQAIDEVIANTVTDIQITQDMVPSARMVAFYVNNNNKVIADSLWIDVEDQCENPVEVSHATSVQYQLDLFKGELHSTLFSRIM